MFMTVEDIRGYMNLVEGKEEKLTLSPLPFEMGDLSPVLSKDNIDYHYNVLSKGYVDRFNKKEGDPKFNYGGAMLHNLFWTQLKKPAGTNNPVGAIKDLIEVNHENYKTFKDSLLVMAMGIQGSGWVYLSKKGEIKTTPNQSFKTDILMPIDMWEHSFTDYVPAKDAKKKYISGMMRTINWDVINQRLS
tara:strand:- start:3101 stop:3667 length:567 start_codon:yes stop_codon:yes gene_type:complete